MNLKWICFDQALEKGMDFYNQGMYAAAKESFQKAFSVSPDDFVLNSWLMRVVVMTIRGQMMIDKSMQGENQEIRNAQSKNK